MTLQARGRFAELWSSSLELAAHCGGMLLMAAIMGGLYAAVGWVDGLYARLARLLVGLSVVVGCCTQLACGRAHDAQASLSRSDAPFALQHAGCLRVEQAGSVRCELPVDRRLTFWCAAAACDLRAVADGVELSLSRDAHVEQGVRYQLSVPKEVRTLTLRAGASQWTLATLALEEPVVDAPFALARELRQRGELGLARAQLERIASQPMSVADGGREPLAHTTLQPTAAVGRRARAELARIALQEADYPRAAAGLMQSFEDALALGRVSEAIADGTALAFVLSSNLRRFDQARVVLTRVEPLAARDDTGRALLPHYQGVLALETGDLRLALRLFREAVRATARLGLREHELLAREQEAWTLSLLGQHAAAIAAQRVLADSSAEGCSRADRYESVVWYALLAGTSDVVLTEIARDYSERARLELQRCASPWRQRNHLINGGLLAEQRGDLAAVQVALQALSGVRGVDDPVLEAWELLLRGRYALRAGTNERALAMFRQALTICQRHGLWEPEQLAQLGSARALHALRGPAAALVAYREAEDMLDRSLVRVPLAEGLGGARHAREAGTYELMELLLQQHDTAGALAVARRARARSLMLLSARERVPSLSERERARWEALLQRYHASREHTAALREAAWQLPRAQERERTREIQESERAAREALDEALGLALASAWRDPATRAFRTESEPATDAVVALREQNLTDHLEPEAKRDAIGVAFASAWRERGPGPGSIADATPAKGRREPSVQAWAALEPEPEGRATPAKGGREPSVQAWAALEPEPEGRATLAKGRREPSVQAWAALEPEPEGRATLALFAGERAVHGFAYGCGPLRHLALAAAPDDPASAWLAPFAADLACASELRVIAPAELSALDVASWELAGAPVLERWAISYALDVPQRDTALPQRGTLRVVDPRADLPLAAREAQLTLPHALGPVRTWTRSAAQRGELLRVLPGLALFHYAGHHRFAGTEGSESELLLSGATLSVGDVLTLSAAPRFVVLSACDSARLDAPGFSAGLDLAYAFVLSGSRAVVAATRPVRDELGYALSAALYAELVLRPPVLGRPRARSVALLERGAAVPWSTHGALDAGSDTIIDQAHAGVGLEAELPSERELVRALRAAQLRVRRELPSSDWSAFRVITR